METQPTRNILESHEIGDPARASLVTRRAPMLDHVIGDFRVESVLGYGGMGTVYKASQISLGRPVALKFLQYAATAGPEAFERFEAEARTAARLNHPNVVHVYSLGTYEDQPYIAMECVPGRNLGEILADRENQGQGPLPIAECVNIMKQACQGLQAAAELGLVHRDLKPENLMITAKGHVKVADFGLARAMNTDSARLTQSGITVGTPMYMSPEQVQGLEIDGRSDIYSLGMTFHHMLTGRPPLKADSPYALAMKQVAQRPEQVRESRPDCPADLSELVGWMIEKSPDARPAEIGQVIEALTRHELGLTFLLPKVRPVGPYGLAGASNAPFEINFPPAPSGSDLARRGMIYWLGGTLMISVLAAIGGRNRAKHVSTSQPAPAWPPGLGVADWKRIEKKSSAEAQYRFAQIIAAEEDQLAAWLAVPGYWPDDDDWAWRAYLQLTGELVRHFDRFRLEWLGSAFAKVDRGVQFKTLQQLIQAAIDGVDGNQVGMLEALHPLVREAMDPNMAELILAILEQYRQRVIKDQQVPARLDIMRSQLLRILRIDPAGPVLNPPSVK